MFAKHHLQARLTMQARYFPQVYLLAAAPDLFFQAEFRACGPANPS